MTQATDQVDAWMASPTLVLLSEPHDHWPTLRRQVEMGQVQGPLVHDARGRGDSASAHGVHELLTADRDFSRFPSLRSRNPLLD